MNPCTHIHKSIHINVVIREVLLGFTLINNLSVSVTVIRAKVVGGKEVTAGNDIYGNPIKRIQYDIKQIKVRREQ